MKQHALQIALDCRKARVLEIQRAVEDLAKRLLGAWLTTTVMG